MNSPFNSMLLSKEGSFLGGNQAPSLYLPIHCCHCPRSVPFYTIPLRTVQSMLLIIFSVAQAENKSAKALGYISPELGPTCSRSLSFLPTARLHTPSWNTTTHLPTDQKQGYSTIRTNSAISCKPFLLRVFKMYINAWRQWPLKTKTKTKTLHSTVTRDKRSCNKTG